MANPFKCSILCCVSVSALGFRFIYSIQVRLSGQNLFLHLYNLPFSNYFHFLGIVFYLLFVVILFVLSIIRLSTKNPSVSSTPLFILVVPQLLFLSTLTLFSTGLFDPVIWLPLYALIQLSVKPLSHSSSFPVVSKIMGPS